MLIGAHVSTDPDYRKVFSYVDSIGAECMQLYTRSPRMWTAPPLTEKRIETIELARKERRDNGSHIPPVLTHTAYLINLAADKPEQREKSITALTDELLRGEQIGAHAVNTHVGSSKELPREDVPKRIAQSIEESYKRLDVAQPSSILVLEISAGQGNTFGVSVTELAEIIKRTDALGLPEIGICIDTCHAWAAGYDLSDQKGWDNLVKEVDQTIGLEKFLWIHANDSMHELASNKDRHQWIGEGEIGYEGFLAMATHPDLAHVNVVTEMPGEVPIKDERNIKVLQYLRNEKAVPSDDRINSFGPRTFEV